MAKDLNITTLYDWYGEMLTEKQQEAVELYYNEDLSLAEIAQHMGITRQGVRDSIKRAETQLLEMEELLGLSIKLKAIKKGVDEIIKAASDIETINIKMYSSMEISARTNKIRDVAKVIAEQ